MQLRRVRDEATSMRERLEADIEALNLKHQQASEREQGAVERERKEKQELREAKVKLESECVELGEPLKRLVIVEQELKVQPSRCSRPVNRCRVRACTLIAIPIWRGRIRGRGWRRCRGKRRTRRGRRNGCSTRS